MAMQGVQAPPGGFKDPNEGLPPGMHVQPPAQEEAPQRVRPPAWMSTPRPPPASQGGTPPSGVAVPPPASTGPRGSVGLAVAPAAPGASSATTPQPAMRAKRW